MKLRASAFILIVTLAQLYLMNERLDEAAVSTPDAAKGAPLVREAPAAPRQQALTSFSEVETELKRSLIERRLALNVVYAGDMSRLKADIDTAFARIFEADNYLHYVTKSYQADYTYESGRADIRFSFAYWETKAGTDYVDANAPLVLSAIIEPHMTDAQKERAIHDWIAAHVSFDETLARHSAYSALAERKTVCQGYALLAYKMLTLAGIEARIVEGVAGNDQHIWNLVKLEGRWQHVDITWDRAIAGVRGVRYDYFNVSDQAIGRDHRWTLAYPKADNILYAAK